MPWERTLEGVRLQRLNPHSRLIFTGFGGQSSSSSAALNSQMAVTLGIAPDAILQLTQPRDTAEEAQAVKALLQQHGHVQQAIILVTSAAHMPRALGSFERLGLKVLPAAVDYRAKQGSSYFEPPSSQGLMQAERLFYTVLGRLWHRLRQL